MNNVPESPNVTIIIAVKNGSAALKRCLERILMQNYSSKEIIVIDGASQDGTKDTILAFTEHLAYWLSEEDDGIYDAWNKALDKARGEWICFLGVDDWYIDPDSLLKLMQGADSVKWDFISARGAVISSSGKFVKEFGLPWKWKRELRRHAICHPGSLHHRRLFDRFGKYNIRYRICADYEFTLRMGPELRAGYVHEVVVLIGEEGISRRDRRRMSREMFVIQRNHPEIGMGRALGFRLIRDGEYLLYSLLRFSGIHNVLRSIFYGSGVLRR